MLEANKEARLYLALQAYRQNPKRGIRPLARDYDVAESTLRKRTNGQLPLSERRPTNTKMTKQEEEVILQRILNLDSRGFSSYIKEVKDIANLILESRSIERVRVY